MSYSFNVRSRTKSGAIRKVATHLDEVAIRSSAHDADLLIAQDTARSVIALCSEPDDKHELSVSIAGHVAKQEAEPVAISLNVTINVLPIT